MKELIVHIERDGIMIPVGRIRGEDPSTAQFRYNTDYLSLSYPPISISLPLQEQPFSPAQTKNFFEGLLPEGFTRRSVAQWMHVDENEYLSILHGLGRECLGALCITEEDEEVTASYEPITEQHGTAGKGAGRRRGCQVRRAGHTIPSVPDRRIREGGSVL